jgi:hypothetical protein
MRKLAGVAVFLLAIGSAAIGCGSSSNHIDAAPPKIDAPAGQVDAAPADAPGPDAAR